MLEDTDLDVAVAEGIVSSAQAASLRELAARRTRERAISQGHEERFRFMRGFNDVFFAVGVALFVAGFAYLAGGTPGGLALTAAVVWALSELLVARLRLVLPGILLAILFVGLVSIALPVERLLGIEVGQAPSARSPTGLLDAMRSVPGMPLAVALRGLVAALAAGIFYFRFKLPFALLPLAGSLGAVVLAVASYLVPAAPIWDAIVLLVCGLAVFTAAMAFDASDRERSTRRADCAFWLHLLAAPLIVHSLIALATDNAFKTMTDRVAVTIVGIVLALTIVAVAIDRRALLVSTLTYLGVVIAYALKAASVDQAAIFAATLLVLGGMVLTLGVGWLPLRRVLLRLVSPRFAAHLPPVVPAA